MTLLNPDEPLPTFYWPVRAYYEDTDASGVVYHAVYLKYFERARTEWLRAMGFGQQSLRGRLDVVFTVANLSVDYLRPARLDDDLEVTVVVAEMRRASLHFKQVLTRRGERDTPLARATVRVGAVDVGTFRPCALPDEFVEYVEKLVAGTSK
ncbi:MAG TPA: tol-pal system-associated acyl-CoA thioesterase [Verrucomicrobiae bacterium]|nr:tol-pal system-associated acyl-CoA thioesterase [Verrucomicrobiae bacterium]